MEYVVGSIAALVSGNTTPSRPRGLKRAADTPVKHQSSPNITPKSEFVNDRSIFLSPTTLKKKAIVKKSPKRIFQMPNLDVTDEKENQMSPKADKVKKHLSEELGGEGTSSKAKKLKSQYSESQVPPESIPNEDAVFKRSKKRKVSDNSEIADNIEESSATKTHLEINQDFDNKEIRKKNKKSKKKQNKSEVIKQNNSDIVNINIQESEENTNSTLSEKKKKIRKSKSKLVSLEVNETELADNIQPKDLEENIIRLDVSQSKNKKRKLKKSKTNITSPVNLSKNIKVNPNAITSKDTDSEHESDNEIASESDEKMNDKLENDKSASEDEEDEVKKNSLKPKKKLLKEPTDTTESETVVHDPDEVNRTLFVGNVPFSKKCKKEIKKIFSSYGDIETVRIRSIPVKDPRFTPRLAAIRGELHPERSAVNVYVKFARAHSVQQALAENGRELGAGHRVRVTPCTAPAHGTAHGTAPAHETARAVFVGNVPFACSDDELRATFSTCGDVHSVRLVRDPHGVGKGFGYVNFVSKDSVELALALTPEQRTLRNRELRVKRCTVSQRDRDRQGDVRGLSDVRGQGTSGMRGRGQSSMRGRGQSGMRGMRGHGQSGIRGHGQSGMRWHGQSGMRGHGQSGMRGRGQSGLRGRGIMRGSTRRHEDTQTDGQGSERQGAFRRLEHKKKKSGGGEFVGLTRDNRTKPTVKPSRKKKALAEIMSKQ